jgi:hypothetical protein
MNKRFTILTVLALWEYEHICPYYSNLTNIFTDINILPEGSRALITPSVKYLRLSSIPTIGNMVCHWPRNGRLIHILKESKKALRIKHTLLLDFTLLCTGPINQFLCPLKFCTALLTTFSSLASYLGYYETHRTILCQQEL